MTWYDVIFPFRRRITSQLNHTKTLQFIPPQHHWCDHFKLNEDDFFKVNYKHIVRLYTN